MTDEATLYRAYIIRCPQNSEGSNRAYFLKSSDATHYALYTDPEVLLKTLERELASVQPEHSTVYWRGIEAKLRGFVKRFVWR